LRVRMADRSEQTGVTEEAGGGEDAWAGTTEEAQAARIGY